MSDSESCSSSSSDEEIQKPAMVKKKALKEKPAEPVEPVEPAVVKPKRAYVRKPKTEASVENMRIKMEKARKGKQASSIAKEKAIEETKKELADFKTKKKADKKLEKLKKPAASSVVNNYYYQTPNVETPAKQVAVKPVAQKNIEPERPRPMRFM